MIYGSGFKKIITEKDIPYEYDSLDGKQGVYNKPYDSSKPATLIYAGASVPANRFHYSSEAIPFHIIFGKGVTSIGRSAFFQRNGIAKISFPRVKIIDSSAFAYISSLKEVFLPNTITLGQQVFYQCSSLKEIALPKVTNLNGFSFGGCSRLTKVSCPKVVDIDDTIFTECYDIKHIVCKQGMKSKFQKAIRYARLFQSIYIEEV